MSDFKRWSETNPDAYKGIHPKLDLRSWDDLTTEEKENIISHLSRPFLGSIYDFKYENPRIFSAIFSINDAHKLKSPAKRFLLSRDHASAKKDFNDILLNGDTNTVIELLSFYAISIREESPYSNNSRAIGGFGSFRDALNDIFEQFCLNITITNTEFLPRQDKKIMTEIYEPVLSVLADKKWFEVNRELSDAFKKFLLGTESGYSGSITHSINALEAFLQITVEGKIGGSTFGALIKDALKKSLIPNDPFTQKIFDNIDSILSRERMNLGDAHTKKAYANEKNSRLMLNLVMIFLQHCIQK